MGRKARQIPDRFWHGGKLSFGEQYYHYPSRLAQDLWHYVVSIGQSNVVFRVRHGHEHEDRLLLHYIHQGEFWYEVQGKQYRATRGAGCLLNLREPVCYGNDHKQVAKVWWVCFGGTNLSRIFCELRADDKPVFDQLDAARIESLFLELFNLTKGKPPGFEPKASGLLTLLQGELFAARESEREDDIDLVQLPSRKTPYSKHVRDSMRYIARFYGDTDLTLKRLSSAASFSLYHFSHQFHREVGMSPVQYLNCYRMEKAKRALATNDQPVSEISRMVGIPNIYRFCRLFRKITGMTPTQFRTKTAKSE